MAHDVFISYSSVDKTAAETVCSILEQDGINCWIAPRDITPGLDFAEAIIDGIKSSKLFILVYTSSSNTSKQVIREVDRAVHSGLPVINIRLEDVPMSKQLEYYLSSVHWLDATKPPFEEHITRLSKVVKMLLSKDEVMDDELEKAVREGTLRAGQYEKSIAVLPFINDSPDQENTYFINGVMEEILNNLQRIKDLRVISRTSVEQYRGQSKPISAIATELGVNYIVEGSGQKYGNNFKLRAQLIKAERESHLWGESFQQKITEVEDIFNIQAKIAETIANELKAVITPEERQLIEKVPTNSIEAYDAYLKGLFYWKKLTLNDLETAMKYFELAKEKDPEYAPAYAGISLVWMGKVQAGFASPEDAGSKITEPLTKALELNSTSAEVHYAIAGMNTWVLWDWEVGESSFKKALELNPNHAEAHAYYSHFILLTGGSEEEAMKQIYIALKLDPLNHLIKSLYGVVLLICGRYDEAIQAFNEALKIEPYSVVALCSIIEPLLLVNRVREGLEMGKLYYKIMDIQKAVDAIDKGVLEGDYNKSSLYLAEALEDQFKVKYYLPFEIAYRSVQCGDKDKALHWLEVGFESHDQGMPYILCYPYIKDLREEPRYKEIVRKMNLPYKFKL